MGSAEFDFQKPAGRGRQQLCVFDLRKYRVNDRNQPITGARFDEVVTIKLSPVP